MVKGFRFSGIYAGIKKKEKNDLGLILSDHPATFSGVTTTNKIYAAPVKYCREIISGGQARAILVNSGNANACTGQRGMRDAESMARSAAQSCGVRENKSW